MTAEAAVRAPASPAPITATAPTLPTVAPARLTIKTHDPRQPVLQAEAVRARWDAYVHRAAGATFCHLSGWQRVIERTWQHRNHSLHAERGGQITGVLPLFHVRSPLFGSMLISTPNAVYGGVVADDAETRLALLERASQLARELAVDFL